MKNLSNYISEALVPQTGIGAFQWGETGNLPHNVIDILAQRLPGMGFSVTKGHVKCCEYKVSHNGYCITIGVRPRIEGAGMRQPSCKIFVRQCDCGMLSVVEKYLNIDGDGKATYKVLSVVDGKFIWTPCDPKELPVCGNIDPTAEFAETLIRKILARCKRYTK